MIRDGDIQNPTCYNHHEYTPDILYNLVSREEGFRQRRKQAWGNTYRPRADLVLIRQPNMGSLNGSSGA